MKIVINATNKISDEPLNVAMRLINKGKAHLFAEAITPRMSIPDFITRNDGDVILNSKQQEALKKFIEEKKIEDLPVITFEDLDDIRIFREPSIKEEVTEVDVIEPISIDHYVDFEEPKISRPKKKVKK